MTRLFGCVCGQFHSPGAGLGMAAERVAVPAPFYVIEHPDGVALFDAGLHDDMQNADDPYRQQLRGGGMLFDLGHEVRRMDGEHDLFGDGAVTCIPSHGHTPGHQSLRVRSAEGDHILVGDACYNAEAAVSRNFPAYADHAAMNRSLDALMAMRGPQTVMIYGHDPGQWGEGALLPSVRG